MRIELLNVQSNSIFLEKGRPKEGKGLAFLMNRRFSDEEGFGAKGRERFGVPYEP
jgi:hypothetical protein